MRHLLVVAAAFVAVVATVAATVGVSREAARERDRVTAVFRPGTPAATMLAAISRAEGRPIRATLLPFALEVAGDRPGIAARLEAAGAIVVLAALPAHALAVGGCSYLSPAGYAAAADRRTTKAWAGPL